MQAWLEEHIPDSEVLSAEADIYMYPSGPHFLTDYVTGTFAEGEKVRDYLANTKTAAIYLIHDGTLLTEACLDYAFDKLELEALRDDCRVSGPAAAMWLPDLGNSFSGTETIAAGTWMPGELALSLEEAAQRDGDERRILEEFVRSPGRREPVRLEGSIRVPEEAGLEKCGMAYWMKQQEENGLVFENFHLYDNYESISAYSGMASYERYCFRTIGDPDIRIFMKDAYWVEKNGRDGIELIESRESDLSDLSFEKTQAGYLVTFPDYEHIFDFSIYADEGSAFLQHEYRCREDREAYLSPGSKISGDRYMETDLHWKEAGEDGYLLTDGEGARKLFFGGEELISRE